MKDRKKSPKKKRLSSPKNKPIHIPLDFEKAVIGLMKAKPKKKDHPNETA